MSNILRKIGDMGLVPVVVINNIEDAIPTAKALRDGGLNLMEITMRTEQGIPAIKAVKQTYPDMLIGAGTVLTAEQAEAAVEAGAEFIVAPGLNRKTVEWCIQNEVPITPGCVTPTEIEAALEYGIKTVKFFPASIYGGINACKALHGPYNMITFIPTGGVNLSNLSDFADKPFIHAIGGGWLCSSKDIIAGNFDFITQTVRESIDVLLGLEVGNKNEDTLEALKLDFSCKMVNSDISDSDVVSIKTNCLDRAIYYMENAGYRFDTNAVTSDSGKVIGRYLESNYGGRKVQIIQK